MATEAFTIRAETDIVHKLDSLAGSLDRSRNYLVNQAIKAYLQANAPACDKINQGIAAADRGEVIAHGPGSEMESKGIRQLVAI